MGIGAGRFFLYFMACGLNLALAPSAKAIVPQTTPLPQSTNIIDLRNGVACANPANCTAGYLDDCNPLTCIRTYNTGRCVPYGDGQPTTVCHTLPVPCPPGPLCLRPTPTPTPRVCQTRTCTAGPVSSCDAITCSQVFQTGTCTFDDTGREYCETNVADCADARLCPNLNPGNQNNCVAGDSECDPLTGYKIRNTGLTNGYGLCITYPIPCATPTPSSPPIQPSRTAAPTLPPLMTPPSQSTIMPPYY